jgi:hypothetical protein
MNNTFLLEIFFFISWLLLDSIHSISINHFSQQSSLSLICIAGVMCVCVCVFWALYALLSKTRRIQKASECPRGPIQVRLSFACCFVDLLFCRVYFVSCRVYFHSHFNLILLSFKYDYESIRCAWDWRRERVQLQVLNERQSQKQLLDGAQSLVKRWRHI